MSDAALSAWARRVCRAGELTAASRIVDVGGAPGALARAIRDVSGAEVTVVDPRPCRHFAPAIEAAAEALPLGDGVFDAVLFSHTLHHIGDPARAVHEAARVLAPSGRLLVRFASHADLRADPRARWMPALLPSMLAVLPDTPDIVRWVESAGLAVERVEALATPSEGDLTRWAEDVAFQAARDWAMRGDRSPDPRPAVRQWALDTYNRVPDVRESFLVARKPAGGTS